MTTARRLWTFVRPYRLQFVATLLVSLVSAPLALLVPIPLRIVVDSILGHQPFPKFLSAAPALFGFRAILASELGVIAFLVIGITILVYGQGLAAWIAQTWLGEKLVLDLRAALLRHAQRLSLAYHDQTGSTDSVYRIQYDAQSLQFVIVNGMIPLAGAALTLLSMVLVMALIDWQLALVALLVCPVLYWITAAFGSRLRRRWFEVKDLDSSAMAVVQEVLSAVRVVKAFGREDYEHDRFVVRSNERLSGQIDLARIQGRFDLAVGATMATGSAIVLVLGVLHTKAGLITVGQLLMVMTYLAQIYEPLKTISKKVADLQSGIASAERALALLDEMPEVPEHKHPKPLARANGNVRFDGVQFEYEPHRPVLRGLTLDIPAGGRVGIQGRTGAGKTTLISLLTRFYDPTSGRILLDDIDIREYRLRDLRDQFAIVLQEPFLFSCSIAENIAYGRPHASEQDIVQAARDANAHDFICSLPDGYRTQTGERGMRLSGGERQRIAIARAFLKNAPILLLDEPTSSVDVVTEAAIMDAMERLMRGRTVFMIAHRLSTLETCDIRLNLEHGFAEAVRAVSVV